VNTGNVVTGRTVEELQWLRGCEPV
jgi:hypothetical protein